MSNSALVARNYQPPEACAYVGPDVMFPEPTDREGIAAAKKVCRSCPIRDACLDGAITRREPDGVWGGLVFRERERLRRRRYPRGQKRRQQATEPLTAPQHAAMAAWEDATLDFAV